MKREVKTKQIVVRFDNPSYERINEYAKIEHRGLGEFVRHAVLIYIEQYEKEDGHHGK
jgi:predicted DNA-binding protein